MLLFHAACPRLYSNQNLVSAGSPRVDGSQARFPISKLKLDNLFLQWLSMAESQSLVTYDKFFSWPQQFCTCYSPKTVVLAQVLSLLEDAKAGRQLARPVEAASPLSPSAAQNLFAATTVSYILTKTLQSWLHVMWPMDEVYVVLIVTAIHSAPSFTSEVKITWLTTVTLKTPRQYPGSYRGMGCKLASACLLTACLGLSQHDGKHGIAQSA